MTQVVASQLVEEMDNDLCVVAKEVENQEYWKVLVDEETENPVVLAIMREIMLEIWSYQMAVNEAVFTAVGRIGTRIEEQGLIRAMIAVQIEEVGHGTLALEDYVRLGGNREFALKRLPSPASQALIGTIKHLSERENPLTHLGFMYFFEKFTTMMTEKVTEPLRRAGYPDDRLQFMRLHSEEDVRHADMLSNVIDDCLARYPNANQHIRYGFDSFRSVYPHAVWATAFERAKRGDSCHV